MSKHKNRKKHLNRELIENCKIQNNLPNSKQQSKTEYKIPQKEIFICKIPVILVEKKIELFLESLVQFDDLVVNINNIKRIVYLTETTIIPIENNIITHKDTVTTVKVFLKGFLRNIIEYAAFSSVNSSGIKADVKQLFVDTPFECTTKVTLHISTDAEPINCELKNSEVFTINTLENKSLINKNFSNLYAFKSLKEKIILTLTIGLTQEQFVNILKKS